MEGATEAQDMQELPLGATRFLAMYGKTKEEQMPEMPVHAQRKDRLLPTGV